MQHPPRRPAGRSADPGIFSLKRPQRIGTDREDPERIFRLSPRDRRVHTQIIGGSGSGKSRLLELLVRQDLSDRNAGLCLIDPHGEVYDDLVHYLSHRRPELASRVILFDPADQAEMVLGFNPLGPLAWENPYFALNAVLTGILKTWGQGNLNETPRIGRWLENIIAVLISNRLTLLEALPLISAARDSSERQLLTRALNTELVRQDWEEYDQATSQQRHAYIEGPHNRMRKLLRSAFIRNMFGVQEKLLDVRRVIEEKKILLVKLAPNDQIDDDDMQMIGILLIHELFRAALRRDPRSEPSPFYLYIDEFARFVTDDIAYMLDQCRKFGLYLTLIHQQLEQLRKENEYLYASVMTNCRNRVVFGSLSYRDAELLSQEIDTGFEDLLEVKHYTEQTKFRPIEELRPTYSCGGSETEGFTAGWQQGLALSNSVGRSLARGQTESESVSSSTAASEGLAHARTLALALGHSRSDSHSHMDSRSTADSAGVGVSRSVGTAHSEGETESAGESSGLSTTVGAGETAGRAQLAYGVNAPVTLSTGTSAQRQEGENRQENTSRTRSQSDTVNQNRGNSLSVQHVEGSAVADTIGTHRGTQESTTAGRGITETSSRTIQRGQATTRGKSETTTDQKMTSLARQFSFSDSRQESSGSQWSVSISPFHRMEEYQEKTPHFWTLAEQRHRLVALLKNQGVAEATFSIHTRPPVRVKIDRVVSPPWLSRSSPAAVAAFRERVYQASPDYYQTPMEAQAEIRARQTKRFARAFDYDWFQTTPQASVEILPPLADPAAAGRPPKVIAPAASSAPPEEPASPEPPGGWKFTR